MKNISKNVLLIDYLHIYSKSIRFIIKRNWRNRLRLRIRHFETFFYIIIIISIKQIWSKLGYSLGWAHGIYSNLKTLEVQTEKSGHISGLYFFIVQKFAKHSKNFWEGQKLSERFSWCNSHNYRLWLLCHNYVGILDYRNLVNDEPNIYHLQNIRKKLFSRVHGTCYPLSVNLLANIRTFSGKIN